jgi:purine-cytosine permease-like protein
MVLSRATFGVRGSIIPGTLSYLIFVGWEIVLISLATLSTGTVFIRIGGLDRNSAMALGFAVAVALTVSAGVIGFSVIMRVQRVLTVVTLVMTAVYIFLTIDKVNWQTILNMPSGSAQAFIGALIFGATGIGLGWVNAAADYSRYLPRATSSKAVVGWTVLGASVVPITLVSYGAALAGSNKDLSDAIAMDPIGALTTILPTWYLIIFALVAILGLVGGAILNLYSSGLTLISLGVPVKRHTAASFDAFLMLIGAIYFVWIADNFFYPFQGILITMGVPIATWSAIFVTDVLMRRSYDEGALYRISGIYGDWNIRSIVVMAVGTFVGWGFVTNTFAGWLSWQGYFLGVIGGRDGEWAYANLGVFFALVIGSVGYFLTARKSLTLQNSAS